MRWRFAARLLSLSLCLAAFDSCSGAEDVQVTLLPEGQNCKPGSRFKIDCNTCFCGENGIAGCTLMGCPGNYRSPDGEQCEGDAVWRRGCNTCNCVNGNAVCTKIACPGEEPRHDPDQECITGSVWHRDCNTCRCINGLASCTRKQCEPGFTRDPDQPDCEGESRWKEDCNWCNCINGKGACTQMGCDFVAPRQRSIPVDAECTEGSVWHRDCNTCRCTNGVASCTREQCRPGFSRDPDQPECEGESRWKKDCNWCNCVNGTGFCTLRGCLPAAPRSPPPGKEECTEGSIWFDLCNRCRCVNGLGVCTRMGCHPEFRLGPDQPECEGESRWKKDCNWCNCIDGKGVCTRKACDVTRGQPRLIGPPRKEIECAEGSVWYKGCNTCRCAKGKSVCTRMTCPPGFLRGPEHPECEGESRWKEDCNWCHCANGRGICTLRACIPDFHPHPPPSSPREPECDEGSVWYKDCNTCRCANGLAVCTRKSCPPGFTRDPDLPDCEGESRWKVDCNWCSCMGGRGACTLKGCLSPGHQRAFGGPPAPSRRSSECTEGSVWYKDCNTCRCANGFGVCTRRACAPGFVRGPEEPECEGDSSWKKDCNWCNCIDGKGVCTRKGCPPQHSRLAVASPDAECTEGSVWYKDCNRCRCINGIGACDRMACRPGFSRNPDQPECEGEARWKKDCNWCDCVNGRGVCTQKGCQHTQQVASTRGLSRSRGPGGPSQGGPQCQGTPEDGRWLKDCNWCSCNGGTAICTQRGCLPGFQEKMKDLPECEGNPHWKDDCNTCRCTNGTASCTRRACRAPAPPADPQAVCTEGSHWRIDCNWCTCANGVAACTRTTCTEQTTTEEPECTDGSRWRHECNQCMCVDGKSVCTKRVCLTAPQRATYSARIVEKMDACLLPPIRESLIQCTGFFRKWTYRAEEGRCEAIVYGGCGGTKNLFDDQETCEAACGTVRVPSGGNQKEELPEDAECTEGSVWYKDCNRCRCTNGVGSCTRKRCRPGFTRDPDQPECEGESRWKKECNWCKCVNGRGLCTQKGCLSDIGDILGRPRQCYKPLEAGPCFAALPRFAFVPERNRCEKFSFGGCQGNDNNFETPEECHHTCGGDQPVLDASCDRSECPWKRFQHYMAKNCTPVYDNVSCCPTSFRCPPASSLLEGPADKCVFHGHEYTVGEVVRTGDPCSASCRCNPGHGNKRPKVTCANIECPDLFIPRDPNCRPIYSIDKCCSVDEECQDPDTPQVAEPRGVTCSWNNQTYKLGDKMFFDGKFACRRCICTADFSDPNGLGCDDLHCGFELRYKENMAAGCIPIFFEDRCCPIEWLCPGDPKLPTSRSAVSQDHHDPGRCPARSRSEEPSFGICAFTCNEDYDCPNGKKCCSSACGGTVCVAAVHDDPVESGRTCHLGELTVPLGEKVPLEGDCRTLCSCSTPPELTCVRYRSCELAAQRDTGCHDIACQVGCEVRLNATTHCEECHCPDMESAALRCPEVRCPHACRSTVLKQDPATGCPSCHCDSCPPRDPITGRPPCPNDCAIEVVQDPKTGCDVCRCTSSTLPMGPPTPCPRLPPGGKLPCPSDCPAGTHTIKDPDTHCLRCVCAPADGSTSQNSGIFFPDHTHCFVDPTTGIPPCPVDCTVRWVKDDHGCDKCECDPNSPPLYPFHQVPQ